MPLLALQDLRLSAADLRVLGALCWHLSPRSHAGKKRPTRQYIGELANLNERQVSASTSWLMKCRWITKTGGGGRFGAANYEINWRNIPVNPDRVSISNPVKTDRVLDAGIPVETGRVLEASNPAEISRDSANPADSDRVFTRNPVNPDTHINTQEEDKSKTSNSESVVARAIHHTTLGEVIEILVEHGMPEAFVNNDQDRTLMVEWTRRFGREEIEHACQRGRDAKRGRNDPNPIGPRYINSILENARRESANGSGQAVPRTRASDDVGDAWLQEQHAGKAAA